MASTTTAYAGPEGRLTIDVNANKTLAAADNGIIQNVIADSVVITLPSTALGLSFTVRNGGAQISGGPSGTGANGTVLVAVSPASADGISGLGFTAANNKDALNTKATAQVGDEISLLGTGTAGVTGWNVVRAKGIWAREA